MLQSKIDRGAAVPRHTLGITARDLMLQEFPPLKLIVPGFVVEGLTVLAGAPKAGKSWMALDWSIAVAAGGNAFGSIPTEQGDVLYLALEDNLRRLQGRLRLMNVKEGSDRLTFMTDWPRLDAECIAELEAWAEAVRRPRLITMDVYAKVKGEAPNKETYYQADYKFVGLLQQFAISTGIALVLIHHTRKQTADDPFDAVSGTRGITGAADSVLVLTQDPEGQQPMLYGRGRDLEHFESALKFDEESRVWRIVGDGRTVAKTSERREILQLLEAQTRPMTPTEIATAIGKERTATNKLLKKLADEGKVTQPATGKYALRP